MMFVFSTDSGPHARALSLLVPLPPPLSVSPSLDASITFYHTRDDVVEAFVSFACGGGNVQCASLPESPDFVVRAAHCGGCAQCWLLRG